LWTENGKLFGKFYEKPRIGYRIDRPELLSKYELIQKEILNKVGEDKIEINNLNSKLSQN
jgi:hypothetical protein